jgi:hypothetical protein
MQKKIIIIIATITVITIVGLTLLVSAIQNQNPKIFCYAYENKTSDWYQTENSPVLSSYEVGAGNDSSLPNVNLGVYILNNNSETVFNVAIEVSYRTTENEWKLTTRIALGFLDIQEYRQTQITLTNPYLPLWHTKRPIYGLGTTTWENVTVYVLNASDYKITTYGFAKP